MHSKPAADSSWTISGVAVGAAAAATRRGLSRAGGRCPRAYVLHVEPGELRDRLRQHGGPVEDAVADRVIAAALGALAGALPVADRAAIADLLPATLQAAFAGAYSGPELLEPQLAARLSAESELGEGRALELSSALYRVLADALTPEAAARLARHLPEVLAEHFRPQPHRAHHAGGSSPKRAAQKGSVAVWDGGRDGQTLGGYSGDPREREGDTLASGQPGSKRKLSD